MERSIQVPNFDKVYSKRKCSSFNPFLAVYMCNQIKLLKKLMVGWYDITFPGHHRFPCTTTSKHHVII